MRETLQKVEKAINCDSNKMFIQRMPSSPTSASSQPSSQPPSSSQTVSATLSSPAAALSAAEASAAETAAEAEAEARTLQRAREIFLDMDLSPQRFNVDMGTIRQRMAR